MYTNQKVIKSLYLNVDDTHELYIEEIGNPDGIPVIYLHGGPGGGISKEARGFFNPDKFHTILFDQRGTGKSLPFLSLENNTIFDSVEDIEKIREYFGFTKVILFGGSYGSTLALAYSIKYPDRVLEMVLRGIFLGRQEDINWLYNEGASYFFPESFDKFKNFIPLDEQGNLVDAYYKRMISGDEMLRNQACKHWSDWESGLVYLVPRDIESNINVTDEDLSLALLESHYFANHMFWYEDNYILNHTDCIQEIKINIFHGRYDVDCRLSSAYELMKSCPNAILHIVEKSGHSCFDQPLKTALLEYMDSI